MLTTDVPALLDEVKRLRAEIDRLNGFATIRLAVAHAARLDALRRHLPHLGAQMDSLGLWEAALVNVARQLASVPEMSDEIARLRAANVDAEVERRRAETWKNEDRKARTLLASLLDLPMPPGAEPPGWTTVLDTVSATVFQLGEARKEIERLTPKWQEGEPPAGQVVWREDGASKPHVVVTLTDEERAEYEGTGVCYWDEEDGAKDWGTARWSPIPTPKRKEGKQPADLAPGWTEEPIGFGCVGLRNGDILIHPFEDGVHVQTGEPPMVLVRRLALHLSPIPKPTEG
jgi:post-segregation antitoxin (ccd killing protein)